MTSMLYFGLLLLLLAGPGRLAADAVATQRPVDKGTVLRILATGKKNSQSEGFRVRLYGITVDRKGAVPLDQTVLSEGWAVGESKARQEHFLVCEGKQPAVLEIPLQGQRAQLRFLRAVDGGHVLVQIGERSHQLDLYSPRAGGRWLSLDIELRPMEVELSPEESLVSWRQRKVPARRNVILVTLDTTRKDHLSLYGYDRPTTPFLEEIAPSSIIFENAYSQVPSTVPSHYSILTSRYCKDLGAYSNRALPLSEKELTLAEVLKEAGWSTGAAVSVKIIGSAQGMSQGVDVFYDATGHNQLGEETTRNAKEFIRQHATEPFFLWIHYFDAHVPYQPLPSHRNLFWTGGEPEQFDIDESVLHPDWHRLGVKRSRQYNTAMYDASLRYQDEQIRDVFGYLQDLDLLHKTIVAITADHGESLGDHDLYYVHNGLYEPTIHVPLIFFSPGHALSGVRVKAVVENLDLAPTIVDLVGLEVPKSFRGTPILGSHPYDNTAYFEHLGLGCRIGATKFWDERERKSRVDLSHGYTRKWWEQPAFGYFDLTSDPDEARNLTLSDPSLVNRALEALSQWYGKELTSKNKPTTTDLMPEQTVQDIDSEHLEALRALGYVE